ncbi:MAG: MFS transporter [Ardenticatenaceae bacterium]|nr:MFS transporter [Ardenticatenaceae bacterium]
MSQPASLPTRIKWLYSLGDISTSMPWTIISFFQLIFLTDVAGLSPGYAGGSILAGRIWDAVNDPLMGVLSDKIRSRWGRRRVVLLFLSLPLGVAFALMWVVPPFEDLALAIYYALTFVLFDTTYTAVHVSYNALTPELTPDYDERSTLNGYRMFFSIGGALMAVIFATILQGLVTDPRTLYLILGIFLGVVTAGPMLIVFRVTEGYDEPEAQKTSQLDALTAIRTTLSNRPFLLLMGLYMFSWTTASLLSSMLLYFARYYFRVDDIQGSLFVLVAQLMAILFLPFWVWVAQRYDKRQAFIWGSLSWVIVLGVMASLAPEQLILAYVLAALSGAGIATAYLLPWSMVPDIVELDELQTGERREGSFYAFASFLQKIGTGLVLAGIGLILESSGYITPQAGQPLPVQPAEAIQAIRLSMGIAPAVLLSIAIGFAWFYPLTREKHEQIRQQLGR